MADNVRRIVAEFSAKNKAKGEMAGFRRDMDRTGQSMKRMAGFALRAAGLGGGLYALKRIMEGSVRAAAEQQKAERALMAAIGQNITQFKSYAAEMQKQTVYGDELIISQMAYAANLGVTTDKLKDATKAAIGLSAKYRIDLATAMMLIGRASMGQTQMLTRYGIVLDQTLSAQDKFNEVLRIGADSFGLAKAAARDAAGTFQQFKNAMGDISETIGGPLLEGLTNMAREVVNNKDKWQEFFQIQTDGWAEVLSGLKNVRIVANELTKNMRWRKFRDKERLEAPDIVGKLVISPKAMQTIAKMRAVIREQEEAARKAAAYEVTRFEDPEWLRATLALNKMTEEQKKAAASMYQMSMKARGLGDELAKELEITKFAALAKERYGADVAGAQAAVERFTLALKESEDEIAKASALKKMNERAYEFTRTFQSTIAGGLEQSMRDFDNWGDHIKNIFKELYWATVRMAFIERAAGPLAEGLTGALAGVFGPGIFAAPARPSGIAPVEMTPALQHGGTVARTGLALVHKGEKYSGVGRNGGIVTGFDVHIHNEGSEKLEISSVQEYMISDQRIIDVTMQRMETDVKYRRAITKVR